MDREVTFSPFEKQNEMHTSSKIFQWIILACIGVKVWHDVVDFMYYREKMRTYKKLAKEGAELVRFVYQQTEEETG